MERRVRVLGFILFLAMFVHAPASSVLRVWGVDFLRDSGCRPWRVLGFEPFCAIEAAIMLTIVARIASVTVILTEIQVVIRLLLTLLPLLRRRLLLLLLLGRCPLPLPDPPS